MLTNEVRSQLIIDTIEARKDLDLRQRADEIANELRSGDRDVVLGWFNLLIDINHAKLHGLSTTHHADRHGGWGFDAYDDRFLSSLRGQFLGNAYGIRQGCFGGGFIPSPLSVKQVQALARILTKPWYTLQLALVERS